MPVIGYISGGLDFSNYFIALSDAVTATNYADAKAQGAVIGYGAFITIALNFAIIAWVLFLVVKAINKAKKKEDEKAGETPPSATPEDVALLREIRDLLAERKEQ